MNIQEVKQKLAEMHDEAVVPSPLSLLELLEEMADIIIEQEKEIDDLYEEVFSLWSKKADVDKVQSMLQNPEGK